jgi:hypothetical protein
MDRIKAEPAKAKLRNITILPLRLIPLLLPLATLGAAGRPEDGFLFFVVLLGLLGGVLGILYLVDLLKILIKRLLERNGEDALV